MGVGVLIALDRRLVSVRRSDLESYAESVWVEIRCKRQERILVGVFYFPPQVSPEEFSNYLSDISDTVNELGSCKCVILGDFNAPGINWESLNISTSNFYISRKCTLLSNFADFSGLTQQNAIRNHQGNVLDLCFSNTASTSVTR